MNRAIVQPQPTRTTRAPRETAQSEALYSKVAERYDTVFERAILAEGRLTELLREAIVGRRVLDLACGNGRWLSRFRIQFRTGRWIARPPWLVLQAAFQPVLGKAL